MRRADVVRRAPGVSRAAGLVLAALMSLPVAAAAQGAPPPAPPRVPARLAVPVVGAIDLILDDTVRLALEHSLALLIRPRQLQVATDATGGRIEAAAPDQGPFAS